MACLLIAAACGGGDDPADPDASTPDPVDAAPVDGALPPLTIDDLCNPTDGGYLLFVDRLKECYPELELWVGLYPDHALSSAICYGLYQPYFTDGSITMGSWEDWNRCVEYLQDTPCAELNSTDPVQCRGVMAGTVPDGAACDISDQCPENSYCEKDGTTTCGACVQGLPNGQPCTTNDACASGNCVGNVNGATGSCEFFLEENDPCYEGEECLGRMMCDQELSACKRLDSYQVGTPCAAIDTGCGFPATDLYCDTEIGQCVRYKALGESCGFLQNFCKLPAYETCSAAAGNTCVPPTTVDEGQGCNIFAGTKCAAGLVCSNLFGGGICRRPRQQGEACDDTMPCHLMLACIDGTCEYGNYTGQCPP